MKKFIFTFMICVAASAFVSCGNKTACTTDGVDSVDTVMVDSIVADSMVVDTIAE